MAVALTGPYANSLHLTSAPHRQTITKFLRGRMLFPTPNQQCQSIEGKYSIYKSHLKFINADIFCTAVSMLIS